ncbi:MAG: hypothetical protein QF876_08000 [Desulfobacterales bacterium]|nr:hypothetical protein [Desulfobacterales bacterium]MDP6808480.1 hypothetical protein [Desulfobacterales bacterium]
MLKGLEVDHGHKGQEHTRAKYRKEFFQDMRAVDISSTKIKQYSQYRLNSGSANGTINIESAQT